MGMKLRLLFAKKDKQRILPVGPNDDKAAGKPRLVSYDRSCDLWSVGVIAYVMLSGSPPFNGPSDDVIFKMIRRARDSVSSGSWENVSDEAKDFVRCLLVKDRSRRCTADAALKHPWLRRR